MTPRGRGEASFLGEFLETKWALRSVQWTADEEDEEDGDCVDDDDDCADEVEEDDSLAPVLA